MSKVSRTSRSERVGKPGSGSATVGLDGPALGTPAMITLDGIVERESGKTPGPPPVSLRAVVIGLVVMFIVGVIGSAALSWLGPQ